MKTKYLYLSILSALLFVGCEKSFDENENQDFIEQGGDSLSDVEKNEFWAWSDKYPGIIDSELERAMGVEVVVKGGYAPVSQAPTEPILVSTGLYVGNNERVKINLPEGVDGLNYQIGISQTLHEDQVWIRYSDIVTRGKLFAGENTISSWFGGFLYLYYDVEVSESAAPEVVVTVDNAVPTYDFIDGVTKPSEWVAKIRDIDTANDTADENLTDELKANRRIDWLELRSDKVIITGGVDEVVGSNLTDPSTLLKSYEIALEQYYGFAGLSTENQPPFRIFSDIQVVDPEQTPESTTNKARFYGSYPLGILRGTTGLDEQRLLNKDNIIYGEGITWDKTVNALSEAFGDKWQKSYNFDTYVKMLAYHYYTIKAYGRMPGNPIDIYKIFTEVLNSTVSENDFTSVSMNVTRPAYEYYSFWRNASAKVNGIPTTNLAFTMFYVLAEYAGWELYPYIYQMGRELNFEVDPDNLQAHYDFFMMRACEYTDRNLAPYFRAWYMPISSYAMEYMSNFTPLGDDKKFWVNTPDRESFWLNYNPENANFEPRTPNKSFMGTIGEQPVFNWHSQYNLYEKLELKRRNSNTGKYGATITKSAMKSDGRLDYNLVDGIVSTHCYAYNNAGVIDTKNKTIHIDIINFYFQQPTDINCMRVANGDSNLFASHIQDMAWMDDAGEWHDIVGQTFSLYSNLNRTVNNALEVPEYMIFQFEEMRKMKALKIEVRTTKNKPQTQFGDIGFGLYTAPTTPPEV